LAAEARRFLLPALTVSDPTARRTTPRSVRSDSSVNARRSRMLR
jgi:hypothetical protein